MSIYEKLNIRRVINASGNNSRLGGCLLDERVLDAMREASTCYVDMEELKIAAGNFIAEITGAEDAQITSGAAGGLLLATAACITSDNYPKMLQLPNNTNAEVILQKGQLMGYHQAIRTAGAKIVEVGLPYRVSIEDVEAAINERTVALCYTFGEPTSKNGLLPLDEIINIGKKFNIPTFVDAAVASYPPSRLREYIEMGSDLVIFSSAKHIFGPPATGFICGKKDLIQGCRLQAGPNYGIGRPMKVSKEEVVGLVKALEIYINHDIEKEHREWDDKIDKIIDLLGQIQNIKAIKSFPDEVGRPIPRVFVEIDSCKIGYDAKKIVNMLKRTDPPIWTQEFLVDTGTIILNPIGLLENDEFLIYQKFREVISPGM